MCSARNGGSFRGKFFSLALSDRQRSSGFRGGQSSEGCISASAQQALLKASVVILHNSSDGGADHAHDHGYMDERQVGPPDQKCQRDQRAGEAERAG
jgi:hypothetical protein